MRNLNTQPFTKEDDQIDKEKAWDDLLEEIYKR